MMVLKTTVILKSLEVLTTWLDLHYLSLSVLVLPLSPSPSHNVHTYKG